jgi:hypothetical protein
MIQLAIIILIVGVGVYFIQEYFQKKRLLQKEEELDEVEMESDMVDIDKKIAEERAYQDET